MAVRVAAGTQMVIQQHIVNTSENPIRVKDGMHLRVLDKADVEVTAGFYGISDINFVLPPDDGKEQEVTFECAVPRDMNLLLMGPAHARVGPAVPGRGRDAGLDARGDQHRPVVRRVPR